MLSGFRGCFPGRVVFWISVMDLQEALWLYNHDQISWAEVVEVAEAEEEE